MKKIYLIKKYVVASSAKDALRVEKHTKPDEVIIDEYRWKEKMLDDITPKPSQVGFANAKNKKSF